MPAQIIPKNSRSNNEGIIHLQRSAGSSSSWRTPDYLPAVCTPCEMFFPRLLAGMKERNVVSRVWVSCLCSRMFTPVTRGAGETEISGCCLPLKGTGDDMVNLTCDTT